MKKAAIVLILIGLFISVFVAVFFYINKTDYTSETLKEWIDELPDDVALKYTDGKYIWVVDDKKVTKPLLNILSEIPKTVYALKEGDIVIPRESGHGALIVCDKNDESLMYIYSGPLSLPCNLCCVFIDETIFEPINSWTYNTETPIFDLIGPLIQRIGEKLPIGYYKIVNGYYLPE